MSPQCSYFQNYSDLLTLLQCQRVTNVTIAVQVHINLKIFFFFFFFFFARRNSASNYREIRVGRGNSAAAEKQRLYTFLIYYIKILCKMPFINCFRLTSHRM